MWRNHLLLLLPVLGFSPLWMLINFNLALLTHVVKGNIHWRTVLANTCCIDGCHTYGATRYTVHVKHANTCFWFIINCRNHFLAISEYFILIPSQRSIQIFTVLSIKWECYVWLGNFHNFQVNWRTWRHFCISDNVCVVYSCNGLHTCTMMKGHVSFLDCCIQVTMYCMVQCIYCTCKCLHRHAMAVYSTDKSEHGICLKHN